jgi:hypothetical protein
VGLRGGDICMLDFRGDAYCDGVSGRYCQTSALDIRPWT